jgi:hypothetical protein
MKFSTPFKIDSFKLRIPKKQLDKDCLPLNLNAELTTVYSDTGEIVESKEVEIKDKATTLKRSNDNSITSISISIENIRISNKLNEFVTLKITSKLLKERYYEGITKDTINDIVKYLNSVGIGLNHSQLVNSEVTDIDICKDFIIEPNEYKQLLDSIKNKAIATKQINKGYNIFNQKDNKGIEFSSRRKATPFNPYLKIYNKYLDSKSTSKNNHSEFFNFYKLITNQNLHRIEFTLKNKKHFEKFNLNNTLETFMNLTQKEIEVICNKITSIHLNKVKENEIELDVRSQLNIYEKYIEICLKYGQRLNIPFETTKATLCNTLDKRTTKNNHNNMFEKVENELKNSSETYKNSSKINEIMEELCLL